MAVNRIKKLAVFLPLLLVSGAWVASRYWPAIGHLSPRRLQGVFIGMAIFYVWVTIGILRRKQKDFFDVVLQSSFYIYVFSVLCLTGYFLFFNHLSPASWAHTITQRLDTRDGVNLEAFHFLKARRLLRYEVIGNFVMLLPLGIYLPLLFSRMKNLFVVTLAAMAGSFCIELMQLATNVRVTDVDDIILNTLGASCGFLIYFIFRLIGAKALQEGETQLPVYS